MSRTSIIVDETIFVYADRANFPMHSQLMLFIDQSDKKNPKRKFDLFMARISGKRLGMNFFYDMYCSIFKRGEIKSAFLKRQERKNEARAAIQRLRYQIIPYSKYLNPKLSFFRKYRLMSLFVYANEAKSKDMSAKGIEMKPSDVIPMEVCEIAQIAYQRKMSVFSFNEDFKYFCNLPNHSKPYITYYNPQTFLQNLQP